MRYERLQWDVSTVTCDTLLKCVEALRSQPWGFHTNAVANAELANIANELRSRLQRTDQDPQCPKRDAEPYPEYELTRVPKDTNDDLTCAITA